MGELGAEIVGEAEKGVGVRSGIDGEVHVHAGLEAGVVVDGVNKGGEDVVGRDRVTEESKMSNIDAESCDVGRKVGRIDESNFQIGFELGKVGCRWIAVLSAYLMPNPLLWNLGSSK